MRPSSSQHAAFRRTLLALLLASVSLAGCKSNKADMSIGRDFGTNFVPDVGSDADVDAGDDIVDAGDDDAGIDAGEPDSGRHPHPDGGGEPDSGVVGKMDRLFGEACDVDSDCKSNICLSTGVCSKICDSNAACPANNVSWMCTQDGAHPSVCYCKQNAGGVDICDGQDNDCNGIVDDAQTAVCPGLQVCQNGGCVCPEGNSCGLDCVDFTSDNNNCGGCSSSSACAPGDPGCFRCRKGELCVSSACVCEGVECPDGSGGLTCVDTTSDNENCGACGMSNACQSSMDCVMGMCGPADHEWTRWVIRNVPDSFSMDADGNIHDFNTSLVWQGKVDFNRAFTQADAATYCAGLSSGGLTWRLPTKAEVWSIVDFTITSSPSTPACDSSFQMPPGQTQFWTSTKVSNDSTKGWMFEMGTGQDQMSGSASQLYVRCVASN